MVDLSKNYRAGQSEAIAINRQKTQLEVEKQNRQIELLSGGYSIDNDSNIDITQGGMADLNRQQTQILSQQLQQVEMAINQQKTHTAKSMISSAMKDYHKTGNIGVIRNLMDINPEIKESFYEQGIQHFMPIDFDNDGELLSEVGLTANYDNKEQRENINKTYFKALSPEGEQEIVSVDSILQGTGGYQYLDTDARNNILQTQNDLHQAFTGNLRAKVNKDELALQNELAKSKLMGSMYDIEGKKLANENKRLDGAQKLFDLNHPKTTTEKRDRLSMAEDLHQQVVDHFGNYEDFQNSNLSDKKHSDFVSSMRLKFKALYPDIDKLTSDQNKTLDGINVLLNLSSQIKDSSLPKYAGILDNLVFRFAKTVSNDFTSVKDMKASAEYEGLRALVRHAFFGTAFTESERKAFKELLPSLGEAKEKTILSTLSAYTANLKAKFNSFTTNKSEDVVKIFYNLPKRQLETINNNLQDALDEITNLANEGVRTSQSRFENTETGSLIGGNKTTRSKKAPSKNFLKQINGL